MKIGMLVKQHIMRIFSRCENVERRELDRLLDKHYSKKTFGISLPFCVKVEEIEPRHSGRFWTEVYLVRGLHIRVTSQWFEANRVPFIEYLESKGILLSVVSRQYERNARDAANAQSLRPPSSGTKDSHHEGLAAAPAQADAPAFNLGLMYFEGRGVVQNYGEATKWYRLAAAQGHAMAQAFLGVMYSDGLGVQQNYAEALKWYRLAAAQGNEKAQYNLGVMYDKGHGVVQDHVEAMQWFRLAAAQGDAPAQFSLGLMYFEGRGIAQDYIEAAKWFRLAAAHGDQSALHDVDMTSGDGQGGPQDVVEAVKWHRLARLSLFK